MCRLKVERAEETNRVARSVGRSVGGQEGEKPKVKEKDSVRKRREKKRSA
jgi:hypothetical protein